MRTTKSKAMLVPTWDSPIATVIPESANTGPGSAEWITFEEDQLRLCVISSNKAFCGRHLTKKNRIPHPPIT